MSDVMEGRDLAKEVESATQTIGGAVKAEAAAMPDPPALSVSKLPGAQPQAQPAEGEQKLPPQYHNYFTMKAAEAQAAHLMNVAHANDKTMLSNALDEKVEEHISYKDYDMDALESYDITGLNLLELMSLRKQILLQLNNLKACRQMLLAVDDLIIQSDAEEANRQVMSANYLDAHGFDDFDRAGFDEFFAKYEPKLSDLVERINTRMRDLREAGVSTKSMTEDMVYVLEKKINGMSPNSPNYEYNCKKLKAVAEAYRNRLNGSIEYFHHKLVMLRDNKKQIRNLRKMVLGTPSDVMGKLLQSYSKETLSSLLEVTTDDPNGHINLINMIVFFAVLNKLVVSEMAANNHVWVDILISNMTDIKNGIFDVCAPQDYIKMFDANVGAVLEDLMFEVLSGKGDINEKIIRAINDIYTFNARKAEEEMVMEEDPEEPEDEASEPEASEPVKEENEDE